MTHWRPVCCPRVAFALTLGKPQNILEIMDPSVREMTCGNGEQFPMLRLVRMVQTEFLFLVLSFVILTM